MLAWSGALSEYHSIRAVAEERSLPFRYETTVGAALPILKTIRELPLGQDSIIVSQIPAIKNDSCIRRIVNLYPV